MTFSYNGINKNKIIKRYERRNNEFLIEYLDFSCSYYSSDNPNEEQKIISLMLEQAKERQDSYNLYNLDTERIALIFGILTSFLGSLLFVRLDNDFVSQILFIVGCSETVGLIGKSRKVNELKKYKLFLELYSLYGERIKNDSKLLNCIECENTYQIPFDINHIDEYSLKDVKEISKKAKEIY